MMELVNVLYSIHFHMGMALCLMVDLPACRNCSNRADVPCRIQLLDRACRHNKFNIDTWPGQPKALTSREVRVNGTSVANFTWKVPYDASYRALDGFLLIISMIENSVTGYECFFANLSGTMWKDVKNPYGVLFHFDCVKSRNQLDVALTLKSSPVPMRSTDDISVKSSLSFQGHKHRHGRDIVYKGILTPDPGFMSLSYLGHKHRHGRDIVYKGILTPDPGFMSLSYLGVVPEQQKNISINVVVNGLTVIVTFGPVDLHLEHDVCLTRFDPSVAYYPLITCAARETVPQGKNMAVFQNISVDQYKVVVQIDDFLFKSKAFSVIAKKPEEESLSHLTILSITMVCLVVVTGTTTLYFCILRKRGHCLSMGFRMCNCYSIYQKASYVPNNVTEDEEDYEVVPLFYPESELYKQAVHQCCLYLSKWSKCTVNFDWVNENNSSIQTPRNPNRPNIAVIFLSSKMLTFLDEMISRSHIVEQTSLQTNMFHDIYQNASKKIFVGLQPVSDTGLHLKDKLELTKHATQRNQLEINTQSLNELIGLLLKLDTTVESGWCSHDELFSLLNAIRLVPPSDLNRSSNQSSKEIVDITGTIPTMVRFQSEVQNDRVPCCTFCQGNDSMHVPLRQKEMDTLMWAQTVQRSALSCPNNCMNSQCQGSAQFMVGNQFGDLSQHFDPVDVGPDESMSVYNEGAVVLGNQGHCPPADSMPQIKWVPPDWDAESDSFSIIGQRQTDIYNDYKASFGETKM